MAWWPLLLTVVISALVSVLALGWRDSWFVRSRRGGPSEVAGQSGKSKATSYEVVAIAEIVRFSALRRQIGYPTARRVVEVLAERLSEVPGVALHRLGRADIEFTWDVDATSSIVDRLRNVKAQLEQPILVGGAAVQPEIAIAAVPAGNATDSLELFDAAALALEDARTTAGRIRLAGEDRSPNRERSNADLLTDLRAAIGTGALELHYMPKLRLHDEKVHDVEALCRWTHPRLGPVPASEFIRLAEDTGLIADLTLWVLARAIADQERLAGALGLDVRIHINMSGILVANTPFCEQVIEMIGSAGKQIGIEITETAVIADRVGALANLERLRVAGIHVAIDDFGAGLASFAYLRDLPADELKIDQLFVRELTTSHRDPLLVRSAIEIAHALEMEVTAEGVEDEIALALLRVMRCDHVQGYHVSPPLAFPQLVQFLRGRQQPLSEALTT